MNSNEPNRQKMETEFKKIINNIELTYTERSLLTDLFNKKDKMNLMFYIGEIMKKNRITQKNAIKIMKLLK